MTRQPHDHCHDLTKDASVPWLSLACKAYNADFSSMTTNSRCWPPSLIELAEITGRLQIVVCIGTCVHIELKCWKCGCVVMSPSWIID